MILRNLTLTGVGPYADRQELDFAAPSAEMPVTLIGGLNGAGKTTLIQALFHVLYGRHAPALLGWSGSYESFLRSSTNDAGEGGSIELGLSVPGHGLGDELLVRRAWEPRGGRLDARVDVFSDGTYNEHLSESWEEVVETFAPRSISRLFFFDGEKVESLANLDRASETLRAALGALLGLDLVDQLVIDLTAVQRRAARSSAAPSTRGELDHRSAAVAAARTCVAEAEVELEESQTVVVERQGDLEAVEAAYRAAGGALHDERAEIESAVATAADEVAGQRGLARAIASDADAPLLLVPHLLQQVRDSASAHQRAKLSAEVMTVLEQRDVWVANLIAEIAGEDAALPITEALALERSGRVEAPSFRMTTRSEPSDVTNLLDVDLPKKRRDIEDVLAALASAEAVHETALRRLAQLPSPDALRILLTARLEAKDSLAAARERASQQQAEVELQKRLLERAEDAYTAAARLAAETAADDQRSLRVTEHADRAKETLAALRRVATNRHVDRLGDYATEALQSLLRKDTLINRIRINADDLAVALEGATADVDPRRLSAGERQLVALALLWGLARAAGRPLPIVIDTPLGRLDYSHRSHVIERYLPAASHQVVVLSTDTEIAGDLLNRLQPSVGASYRLAHDHNAGRTSILPGYLEGIAA